MVRFSKSTPYTGMETSGMIPVTLLLEGGTSASVITVTVTPFDQSPVSAQGKMYMLHAVSLFILND